MRTLLFLSAAALGFVVNPAFATEGPAPATEQAPLARPAAEPAPDAAIPSPPIDVPAVADPAGPAPENAAEAQPEKPKTPPPPTLFVNIDLSRQRLHVRTGSHVLHTWPISSGLPGYETPRGTYRGQWAAKLWRSRKYDLAPMPHSIFFNGGVAVHGTSSTRLLGQPASHGCVRLSQANAATLYALAHKHGIKQTQFRVFGTPPAPRVAERRDRPYENRWQQPPPRPYGYAYGYYGWSGPNDYARPSSYYGDPGPYYRSGMRYERYR